ncbi:hypothetical protein CRUP_025352 [Coryphaenoides rupestris]|nr:hypothetical protein CRUP_025352 [Coryphaenoides rupestris]
MFWASTLALASSSRLMTVVFPASTAQCSAVFWWYLSPRFTDTLKVSNSRPLIGCCGCAYLSLGDEVGHDGGVAKLGGQLLKYSADPSLIDGEGCSCVHLAAQFGHTSIVAYLIAKGQSPGAAGIVPPTTSNLLHLPGPGRWRKVEVEVEARRMGTQPASCSYSSIASAILVVGGTAHQLVALLDANNKLRHILQARRSSEATARLVDAMEHRLDSTFPPWSPNAEQLIRNPEDIAFLAAIQGGARAALPPAALRLLVPPLRLLAAFTWQVIQRRRVLLYDRLADLVALVTEEVPELLGPSHKAQLILGLRARLVLEFCRADGPAGGLASIQQHLGKIQACTAQLCSAHQEESGIEALETSYTNFSKLVLKLISVPSEKEHFLREVFPVSYGEAYDRALQRLVAEFLARLEQLLPTPTLAQTAAWLSDGPSVEEEFSRSLSDAAALKTLLLHHRQLGALSSEASPCREEEPSIMAVLALSHEAAAPSEAAAHREEVEDSRSSEEDSRDSSALAPTGPPGDEPPSPRLRLHAAPPPSKPAKKGCLHSNNHIGAAHIPTATPTEPGEQRHPARARRGRRRVKGAEVKGVEQQAEGAEQGVEQKADRAEPPAASPADPSGLDRHPSGLECPQGADLQNQHRCHSELTFVPDPDAARVQDQLPMLKLKRSTSRNTVQQEVGAGQMAPLWENPHIIVMETGHNDTCQDQQTYLWAR